jgi:hypothetical protein
LGTILLLQPTTSVTLVQVSRYRGSKTPNLTKRLLNSRHRR